MEKRAITEATVMIAFSREEVIFLSNAINETLDAIEDWEFQTRTGETRTTAEAMLAQLKHIIGEFK